ncbi:Assimilatory nitrate reductase large subunit [Caenispirillum salinarum AK4]|uniref:Assimilatory nitrate reductase large subunit n=1 Tax=Caenispirillum salinarum AK4 TaxID=1238182 RepID=K9GW20_9PROT|nr:nitrate reductase [Caenispirillum salinarum]EKV28969.1 Assimilatory nitrate reductase large subunit [Caenispirillum salinarum AK4]
MAEDTVKTTCPYCGVGCGLILSRGREGWEVGGDPDHPANKGRLCSKGAALMDTVRAEDAGGIRLLHPEVDGRRASWDEAVAATAARLRETVEAHGPDAVAFYVSGQLLTEDYYVANKLLKGFIGSPHIDTNSRLCMASTVAGHKRAFGADAVPGTYEDLELADLVVLVGSNLAWCHPVLAQRLRAARRDRGTKVVVIDPRETATRDLADLHLKITPGSDVALFNGLLAHLARTGAVDGEYVARHVSGLDTALEAAEADAAAVAETCGVDGADLARFYQWVAATPRTVSVFSQGVNQSSRGTDKVNAILNVHLATGRVGKPGASPFSVTGQPNAMGGREVGGLANQLAAHMNPDDPHDVDRLRRFWKAPALTGGQGLKAVDLFRAVRDGRIKALWIMATNPAVSLPEAGLVRAALEACPTVIVSDVVADTDTMRHAHIRLPAAGWGEKDGTVTNSERRISRQRAFRPLPGEARPDWRIMSDVARALGHGAAFPYKRPADIFREHAALSAFENDGARAFDIGAFAAIKPKAFDALAPVQWPAPMDAARGTERMYGDGRFTHSNGRGRMIAVRHAAPMERASLRYPLILNTGRYRDQWHTMTRTGLSPRLSAHRPEPLVEVHPDDAGALIDGGLARVTSGLGSLLARVAVTEAQRPGEVFLPMHWSDTTAAAGAVGRLVAGHVDALSGQPESKHVPVRVEPWAPAWEGLLLCRAAPDLSALPYWVRQAAGECLAFDLAGDVAPDLDFPGLTPLEFTDPRHGVVRRAWMDGDRLEAVLFTGADRPQVARSWLVELFAAETLSAADRAVLLAGRAPDGSGAEDGGMVCSCHAVSREAITVAAEDGAASAEDIGRRTRAGTGCGSCVPEIKDILRRAKPAVAA